MRQAFIISNNHPLSWQEMVGNWAKCGDLADFSDLIKFSYFFLISIYLYFNQSI